MLRRRSLAPIPGDGDGVPGHYAGGVNGARRKSLASASVGNLSVTSALDDHGGCGASTCSQPGSPFLASPAALLVISTTTSRDNLHDACSSYADDGGAPPLPKLEGRPRDRDHDARDRARKEPAPPAAKNRDRLSAKDRHSPDHHLRGGDRVRERDAARWSPDRRVEDDGEDAGSPSEGRDDDDGGGGYGDGDSDAGDADGGGGGRARHGRDRRRGKDSGSDRASSRHGGGSGRASTAPPHLAMARGAGGTAGATTTATSLGASAASLSRSPSVQFFQANEKDGSRREGAADEAKKDGKAGEKVWKPCCMPGLAKKVITFQDSWVYNAPLVAGTAWSLIAGAVQMGMLPKDVDVAFELINAGIFFVFLIDFFLNCWVREGYLFRLFFWLDLLAILSLLTYAPTLTGGNFASDLSLAKAGKAARAGTRAGRLVRVFKLFKLYRERARARKDAIAREEEQLGIRRSRSSRKLRVVEDPFAVELAEVTTQKVIVVVIALVAMIPLLDYSIEPPEPAVSLSLVELSIGGNSTFVSPTSFEDYTPEKRQFIERYTDVNTTRLEELVLRFGNPSNESVALYDRALALLLDKYRSAVYLRVFRDEIINDEAKLRELRSSELAVYATPSNSSYMALDIRTEQRIASWLQLALTFLIIFILALSAIFFSRDSQTYFKKRAPLPNSESAMNLWIKELETVGEKKAVQQLRRGSIVPPSSLSPVGGKRHDETSGGRSRGGDGGNDGGDGDEYDDAHGSSGSDREKRKGGTRGKRSRGEEDEYDDGGWHRHEAVRPASPSLSYSEKRDDNDAASNRYSSSGEYGRRSSMSYSSRRSARQTSDSGS